MTVRLPRSASLTALLAGLLLLTMAAGCPPLAADGTIPGTCTPGAPGCKQGSQCQSREANPHMPIFHIVGNFTNGDGAQPAAINDVSSIIEFKGVWHIFHQFGQCGWAHAVRQRTVKSVNPH